MLKILSIISCIILLSSSLSMMMSKEGQEHSFFVGMFVLTVETLPLIYILMN